MTAADDLRAAVAAADNQATLDWLAEYAAGATAPLMAQLAALGTQLATAQGERDAALAALASTSAELGRAIPYPFTPFAIGAVKPVGTLDPGVTNVGPRVATYERHDGDLEFTKSDKLAVGLEVFGSVTGRGGTARDCIVHGRPGTALPRTPMAYGTSYDFGGQLFEWCRFDGAGYEGLFTDCLNGGGYLARYCELLRGVDGVGMNAVGRGRLLCSRVYGGHYFSWWDAATAQPRTAAFTDVYGRAWAPPFPDHPSGDVHGDGVQVHGWAGWEVAGSRIGGRRSMKFHNVNLDPTDPRDAAIIAALDGDLEFTNAAVMVNGLAAHPTVASIHHNWLEGGNASVNLANGGTDLLLQVSVTDNIITNPYGWPIYATKGCKAAVARNVDEQGRPIAVKFH